MFSFLRGGLWDHRRQGLPEGFIFSKPKLPKGHQLTFIGAVVARKAFLVDLRNILQIGPIHLNI